MPVVIVIRYTEMAINILEFFIIDIMLSKFHPFKIYHWFYYIHKVVYDHHYLFPEHVLIP